MKLTFRRILLLFAIGSCLLGIYLATIRPGYFTSVRYLGAIIFLQLLLAALWNYRQRFFPLLLLIFFWAGIGVPLASIWTSGRWFVLAVGGLAGFAIYLRDESHHFGMFHLVAFVCVLSAVVSAMVSSYPATAILKALSLLLLFFYGSAGARLAVIGRETRFFSDLFVGVEVTNTGTTSLDPQGGVIESKGNVDSEFDPDGFPVIDFNDQCFGDLAPGESCTVTVRFWPMSVGERHVKYVLTLPGGEPYSLVVHGVGY